MTATRDPKPNRSLAAQEVRVTRVAHTLGGRYNKIVSSMSWTTIVAICAIIGIMAVLCIAIPILSSDLNQEHPGTTNLSQRINWTLVVPTMLGLLPTAVVISFVLLSNELRRALIRYAKSLPRDLAEIKVLVPDVPVFEWPETTSAVQDLMRPRQATTELPDLEQSVDATARAGGLATLVPRSDR